MVHKTFVPLTDELSTPLNLTPGNLSQGSHLRVSICRATAATSKAPIVITHNMSVFYDMLEWGVRVVSSILALPQEVDVRTKERVKIGEFSLHDLHGEKEHEARVSRLRAVRVCHAGRSMLDACTVLKATLP